MITPANQRRIERNRRRIEEIRAWRDARIAPLATATFRATPESNPVPVAIGDAWPTVALPVTIELDGTVPTDFAGQCVELELWLGGEGFAEITFDGAEITRGAIDPYHFQYPLTGSAAGGETLHVQATVVPRGLFGSPIPNPRIERANLVVPEQQLRDLDRDLTMALQTAAELDQHDHEIVPRLLDLIEATTAVLTPAWPSGTETTLNRFITGAQEAAGSGVFAAGPGFAEHARLFTAYSFGGRWTEQQATGPMAPATDAMLAAADQARATLGAGLDRLRDEYPSIGAIALTGHAHIDLAWLWSVAETRRKIRRTGWSVLNLMDQYPEFIHNQSSAQVYAWLEEDDPDLLVRIRQRAAEGRWDPVGGMWCEPDNQLTGGEAMVRQALYGQREFERHFGRRSTVAWLPDSFGFSGGLPQILAGAGLTRFFTHKMTWNEENDFPWDLFLWEGVDGTRVLAHQFRNEDPAAGYNGEIHPRDVYGTWKKFVGKRQHGESLLAFGMGDGGGGPSRQALENYARLRSYPVLPRLRMATVEDFFADIETDTLPVWVGEMYLELHRGTLTSQGRTKKLNRDAEQALAGAETIAALASLFGHDYPGDEFAAAWKVLLLNQFHDILPGSSIREVYETTEPELTGVVATAHRLHDTAFGENAATADAPAALRVLNTLLAPHPLTVLVPGTAGWTDSDGEPLPTQSVEGGVLVHAADTRVPGLGWTTLLPADRDDVPEASADGGVRAWQEGDTTHIENGHLHLVIGADGTFHGAKDMVARRDIFSDRGNQLWAYADKPRGWDAWDVDEGYDRQGEEIVASEPPTVVESGPLRAAVRVIRSWRGSRITQTVCVLADSRLIEIDNDIDWHERQVLLKAVQPLNIHSHEATFETLYGVVRRPTNKNTSWERARFEVAGHRFADLSEANYGVSIVNDGRYGHGLDMGQLTLSLLRSPIDPDMLADEGQHRFRYGILPHDGTYATGGVVESAHAFNRPLVALPVAANDTDSSPTDWTLIAASGLPLTVGALKQAEDGDRGELVLRLHEANGARGQATLQFSVPVSAVQKTNLLEDDAGEAGQLAITDDAVTLDVRPYEIITLRIAAGDARAEG